MRVVRVADIKSGATYLGDPTRLRQVLGQGFACWSRARSKGDMVDGFVPGIYYARTGLFDWGKPIIHGTPAWDEAWEMVVESARRDQKPYPGAWCLGCYDKEDCRSYPGATP